MSDGMGMVLVLVALGGLMLTVKGLQGTGKLDAEVSRKLVHIGMGVICLTFPWLFTSSRPVWVLALLAVGALSAVRLVPALRKNLGGVLGGVQRVSWGELYFPVAVAAVFSLSAGRPADYCIPVAVLTFADAAGALVGQRWGRHRYQAVESTKSVEGSLAVCGVTIVCVVAGFRLFSDLGWTTIVLTALTLGLFATMLEAVSWRGLDNLVLPIAAFAQLEVFSRLGETDLGWRLGVLTACAGFMLVWRRQHLLDDGARLGVALVLYLFWAVGGWQWLVAPALLMLSYVRLMPAVPGGPPTHNLMAVICIASAGVPWMIAEAVAPQERWLWLFTLGLATQQAIIAAVRFSQGCPRWSRLQWWAVALGQALGVQGLGFWAAGGRVTVASAAAGAGAVALTLALFMIWERRLSLPDDLNARWWRQGFTALLASLVGYLVLIR